MSRPRRTGVRNPSDPRGLARQFALGAVLVLALASCGLGSSSDEADELDSSDVSATITVTSPAFGADSPIPERYSCAGDDVSPPVEWTGVPEQAAEVAIVVDDPDAPGGTFVHWVVVGIDPATTGFDEGEVPEGAVQISNSADKERWSGPCPPEGPAHHYRFTVYALDEPSGLEEGADPDEVFASIREHAVARGRLTATFER